MKNRIKKRKDGELYIEEARILLNARTKDRIERGVEGKQKV